MTASQAASSHLGLVDVLKRLLRHVHAYAACKQAEQQPCQPLSVPRAPLFPCT